MNRGNKTICITGAITLAVTLLVMALCVEKWTGILPLATAFMAWAEVAFFGGLLLMRKIAQSAEQVMIHASFSVVISVYSIAAFLLSIIFICMEEPKSSPLIAIQLVLAAVAAVVLVIFSAVGRHVKTVHDSTADTTSQINAYVDRLQILATEERASDYASSLKRIAENLRFTDMSTVAATDDEIERLLSELELAIAGTTEKEEIEQKIVQLNSLSARRKIETTAAKRGRS